MNRLGSLIRKLRLERGLTLEETAAAIGTDAGNLSRRERGMQSFSEEQLRAVAAFLKLNLLDLYAMAYDEETLSPVPGARSVIEWEHPDDLPPGRYVLVPRLTLAASAGNGHHLDDHEIEQNGSLAFLSDWIRQADITSTRQLVVIDATGDSMSPRIQDGDVLLVDRGQTQIREGRVYVLCTPDGFKVKRLLWRMGKLLVTSDNDSNPAYRAYEIDASEVNRLRIIGRVVWVGGKM